MTVSRCERCARGALHDVAVRRKVVDARYLEASVPATHTAPFDVATGARVVAINDLPAAARSASSYTVLGSGKTAVDACTWLLDNDVNLSGPLDPAPRTPGFTTALTSSRWSRLVRSWRASPSMPTPAPRRRKRRRPVRPARGIGAAGPHRPVRGPRRCTAARCSAPGELDAVRQIEDVVRLGHVRRIEGDRIVLAQGETRTGPEVLHVDCTALGLRNAPATPIFQPGRIVLQQVRHNSPTFNAALVGFVEGHRDDEPDKNRLCPPNPYASSIDDWPRMMSRTWRTEQQWMSDPTSALGWLRVGSTCSAHSPTTWPSRP